MMLASHPILSCEESGAFEARLFGGDEAAEWPAMQRAGRAVAAAVLWDFEEIGGFPPAGRVLVLVGKGHNGGESVQPDHPRATPVHPRGAPRDRPHAHWLWETPARWSPLPQQVPMHPSTPPQL